MPSRAGEPVTAPFPGHHGVPAGDDSPTGPLDLGTPVASGPGSAPGDELGQDAAGQRSPTLLEQMGGVAGVVASGVPVVVFVVVQAVSSVLVASIVAAVVASVAIAVWRLTRGEALQPAFAGLFGVAVCAFIAWRTGEAKGFFLLGIWTSLLYGGAFLLSVLVRRPLVGVIWHGINGDGQGWRTSAVALRAFDVASLAWVVVFGARFVVQRWLYDANETGWLGFARLAMGLPLAALAALVTIWAIRRSQHAHAAAAA